jgi:hypothetical protein
MEEPEAPLVLSVTAHNREGSGEAAAELECMTPICQYILDSMYIIQVVEVDIPVERPLQNTPQKFPQFGIQALERRI